MKCYRKNGSDNRFAQALSPRVKPPSMKCYRKNGSDMVRAGAPPPPASPSMKCYRKNGSDIGEPEDQVVEDGPQ